MAQPDGSISLWEYVRSTVMHRATLKENEDRQGPLADLSKIRRSLRENIQAMVAGQTAKVLARPDPRADPEVYYIKHTNYHTYDTLKSTEQVLALFDSMPRDALMAAIASASSHGEPPAIIEPTTPPASKRQKKHQYPVLVEEIADMLYTKMRESVRHTTPKIKIETKRPLSLSSVVDLSANQELTLLVEQYLEMEQRLAHAREDVKHIQETASKTMNRCRAEAIDFILHQPSKSVTIEVQRAGITQQYVAVVEPRIAKKDEHITLTDLQRMLGEAVNASCTRAPQEMLDEVRKILALLLEVQFSERRQPAHSIPTLVSEIVLVSLGRKPL